MNTLRRFTAVVACCSAAISLSAPPPLSVSTSDAPTPDVASDYPLSCEDIAKPMVFKAWNAMANARVDEARETLQLALIADPKCVMARASLGAVTPGAAGKRLFDGAMARLSSVSEVEQLDLKVMQAARTGELRKAFTLAQELAEFAPDVFMVNLSLAHTALALEEWDEAERAAQRATVLSPANGTGWNLLGYARLRAQRTAQAIEAFRKYIEVAPDEPNAHDSLGDALLADNQLEAAAAEYQRAIDGSAGKFWLAWSGLASVKALQGDWVSARVAIEGEKAAAIEPLDKLRADSMRAWSFAAQGQLPAALKVLEAARREAMAAKVDAATARTTLIRAQLNLASGKYAAAVKDFAAANKMQLNQLSSGQRKRFRGQVFAGLTAAQARLGQLPDAARTLAKLDEFAQADLSGPFAVDATSYARGVLALAQGDARAAVQALSKCSASSSFCQLALAEAQEEAGETAAAATTREALRRANYRDPEYWFVRARIEARMKESAM